MKRVGASEASDGYKRGAGGGVFLLGVNPSDLDQLGVVFDPIG